MGIREEGGGGGGVREEEGEILSLIWIRYTAKR